MRTVRWLRWDLALLVGLASCLRSEAPPRVAPSAQLRLSETASGPRGKAVFAVVAAGPRGEASTTEDPGITLVFNRAMRHLETPEYDQLPAVRLEPSGGRGVKGRFRWIGTHGVLFEPEEPLPGATRFTVTVPAGTRALDGSRLTQDYKLEFATERPSLARSYPAAGARTVRPDESLFLRFTQPIDPAELARKLQLTTVIPGQKSAQPLPVTVRRGAPHWFGAATGKPGDKPVLEPGSAEPTRTVEDPTGLWLEVKPSRPLPADTALQLTLTTGIRGLAGPLPTEAPTTLAFRTYGPLRVEDVRCARQNLGRCQAHRDFTAILTNPVHPEEFRRFLQVKGPKRPTRTAKAPLVASIRPSTSHGLSLDPDYGDAFELVFRAGMSDVFGQKLAKDTAVRVQVEEPFVAPPAQPATRVAAAPATPAAPRPAAGAPRSTQPVPQRPTLQYGLELGIRGQILEALGGIRGTAGPAVHELPVGIVNVPTYGLYSSTLPELSTVRWLGAERGGSGEPRGSYAFSWISPAVPKNTRSVRPVNLDALLGGLGQRGSALVALTALGQGDATTSSLVSITDLGLSARVSQLGSLIWVTHLSSGSPAPGATVRVYDKDGTVRAEGQSDTQGLVTFSQDHIKAINPRGQIDSSLIIVARLGEDWTFQRLEPTRSGTGADSVDYAQRTEWAGLVFTDRGVYRPGETVKAGGYFRRTAEKGFRVMPGAEIHYSVRDAQGELVADGRGTLDAFGALAVDVGLSKSAALGQATLEARFGRKDPGEFSTPFEILAYKPAEFKVTVEPSRRDAIHGESVDFGIQSEYLFGAPVAEGKVEEYVTRSETYFRPPNTGGYVVDDTAFRSDLRWTTNRGSDNSQKTEVLAADGRRRSTVALNAPEQSTPEQLVFEAEVQDLSAQTQSGRASVLVHPAAYYLGLRAPKKAFFAVGADFPAEVLAVAPSGTAVEGVPVEVELWRRTWSSVVEDRPADTLHYQTHVRDEKVARCPITSQRGSARCGLKLPSAGFYIARASSRDRLGNPVYASLGVYAVDDRADSTAAPIGWQEPDRRGLFLEPDQKKYEPGNVARILVKSPFPESTALVTVERAGVMDRKVVPLQGRMPIIEIPVKEEYFPNAFVSVHLLRGRVSPAPAPGGADVGAPDFRLGYTALRVDPESRRLKVEIIPGKKEYRPGQEVEARVSLRRTDGSPAPGSVTFYAVDEGVLMLTGYQTPDPLPAFSSPRSLGVFAAESRENLARIILLRNGESVPSLGFEMARGSGADKGDEVGGTGDKGRLRGNFRTTAFFEAGHRVGTDGQATFRFKLPDNLTSYRLMAVAAGTEDRFGYGAATITTNRKLMARPALPRALRVGDRVEAGVLLTSKDLGRTPVDVSLITQGAHVVGPAVRRVDLPKNGQVEVRFPVQVSQAGSASFEFQARAGSEADRVKVSRPVEQPIRWLSAASFGATSTASAVSFGDLSGMRQDLGELRVTVSPSALVGLKAVFEELSDYPYGCTEQLASRVLPALLAGKLAEQQGLPLGTARLAWVDEALGQMVKRQRGDGSFGFWEEDGATEPWLSAYALWALEKGNQSGYFVPKQVRDQAGYYLLGRLDSLISELSNEPPPDAEEPSEADSESSNGEEPSSESPAQLGIRKLGPQEKRRNRYAQATFIADVLASLGQLDEPRLRKLSSSRSGVSLSSRALLLHAMAVRRLPREELNQLLTETLREVSVGPTEARVAEEDPALESLFESPARTTAWMLRAVLAVNPKHSMAPALARGLIGSRNRAGYRNTQEAAWALMALEDYRKAQENNLPQIGSTVFLGNTQLGDFHFGRPPLRAETVSVPFSQLAQTTPNNLAIRVNGPGSIHYAVELKAARDGGSATALDEGLAVDKRLRSLDAARVAEASRTIPRTSQYQAQLGQLVMVDLLIETAEPRDQLVIEDPLPAGLEPIEFGFATTAQALSSAESSTPIPDGKAVPQAARYGKVASIQGLHREMRDDRVLLFIPQVDAGIYHFRYLARATTPGSFVMPPTRASCMYDPEIFGQSKTQSFEVTAHR